MNRMEKLLAFLADQPQDPFLRHALALEYQKADRWEEAIEIWEKLLSEVPGYVGSYYHLAGALARQNQSEKAIQWYEKGMATARKAGDTHAFNELRSAYDAMTDS